MATRAAGSRAVTPANIDRSHGRPVFDGLVEIADELDESGFNTGAGSFEVRWHCRASTAAPVPGQVGRADSL
jgi:hypothetical protein